MIVFAYYTADGAYPEEADRLESSLRRVGMKHIVRPIPATGDWNKAVWQKPFQIRSCLTGWNEPVLYIDVDAVVHANCSSYFAALEPDYDFACHWFQGPAKGQDQTRNDNRLLSGTLWFNTTDRARRLLDIWCQTNRNKLAQGDETGGGQRNLWETYHTQFALGLRSHNLPGRYCYVFDKPWAYPKDEPKIIEHLIASRENRGESAGIVNEDRQQRIREILGE